MLSKPYKHMNENLLIDTSNDQTGLQDDEQEAFMSFTPKTTDIQRRYTQKKPVRIDDFITNFEQERSPSLPTTPSIIIQDNNNLIEDEFDDFSDTARLTVNASSVSGFSRNKQHPSDHRSSIQYQRTSKLYEPAIIDPEIDQRTRRLNKVIHFDKSAVIRKLSRSIRRVSKRVINVHNNNSDSISQPKQQQNIQQQQHRTTVSEQPNDHDSDTSSFINEVIPLSKPISSNNPPPPPPPPDSPQNTTLLHSTSYYVNPEQKDTKEYIVLSGDSLKLLSPANPFRMCLANMLCWK
ncbi:hypothetical protein HPULCUR_006186 [Helicostylum pulchrum]|uniref:Uncharacterized protein n=1 Tax=Helicostylum pulchrum TaxID=562976 RepID=A0ABP9Y2F5_9FUNG